MRRILNSCRKYSHGCCLLPLPPSLHPSLLSSHPFPPPPSTPTTSPCCPCPSVSHSSPCQLYYIRSVTPKHRAAVSFLLDTRPGCIPRRDRRRRRDVDAGGSQDRRGVVVVRSGLPGRGLTPNWDEDTLERVTALPRSPVGQNPTQDLRYRIMPRPGIYRCLLSAVIARCEVNIKRHCHLPYT